MKLKYTKTIHQYITYQDTKYDTIYGTTYCCDKMQDMWGYIFDFGIADDEECFYVMRHLQNGDSNDYKIKFCPFCSARLKAECTGVERYTQVVKTVTEVIPAKETTKNVTEWVKSE